MMKRTIVAVILVAMLFCSFAPCLALSADAASLYARKIVSLVYDNSGSMTYELNDDSGNSTGVKKTYASYAMQTFCGMLNSEDQLYVTYMSNPHKPIQLDLSAEGIQSSVDGIKGTSYIANTPFAAVETAFNKLESITDNDPHTEYWLVVITDGNFTDVQKNTAALNKYFEDVTSTVMPNGTTPQVTFLAIGKTAGSPSSNYDNIVVAPDSNEKKGIYSYTCGTARGITSVMSQMADRISGRTRIEGSDITQVDDTTVKVSSSIPLLNIAMLSQSTEAQIIGVTHSDNYDIPVSRRVRLESEQLKGGAFLLGDSQTVIGGGTYTVTFDQKVNAADLVALFEPALEVKVSYTVNGKEISNPFELENTVEGDKIGVSFRVCEMGTDKTVSPDQLPAGTEFSILLYEDGKLANEVSGDNMTLEEYELKMIETEIVASVKIDRFNPIESSVTFTPDEYVAPTVYTLSAEIPGEIRSIKLDDIPINNSLTVEFTILADGVPITDEAAINAFMPSITAEPVGNGGSITLSDGKLVFTPNTVSITSNTDGYFDVTVTCTLNNGLSASETYRVLISEYLVIPISQSNSIVKTSFFGNKIGASFYITKDGSKLGRAEVQELFSAKLDGEYSHLKIKTEVLPDGTIVCTPYDSEEFVLTFGNWWRNWYRYWFELPGSDLTVTLNHGYGTASAEIEVVGEDLKYLLLCVWAPLAIEIILAIWLLGVLFTRPFERNAVVYIGKIDLQNYPLGTRWHDLNYLTEYNLNTELRRQYWRVLVWPFRPVMVKIDDITITRAPGGRIKCEPALSYQTTVSMRANPEGVLDAATLIEIDTPQITEIEPIALTDSLIEIIPQDDSIFYGYNVFMSEVPVNATGTAYVDAIESASVICYTSRA